MFRISCFAIVFMLTLSFQVAHACSCAHGGYWVSEFVEDKIIFEGQVLQTKWLDKEESGHPFDNSETTFKTTKSLIGNTKARTVVRHHSDGAACGMFFTMGSDRVVITYKTDDGAYRTDSCTSNAVPQSTLLDYFENDTDTYIPSRRECPKEQINNVDDPKNCHFWSDEAERERQDTMISRWRKKRDEALKKSQE